MGKFGKDKLNNNGEHLLQMASRNELILTNTLFEHKMAHRTTWTAPEKHTTTRRNPVRNQIDYIMIRSAHRCFLQDARSYNGTEVYSDHSLVISKMDINWYKKTKHNSKRCKKINLEKLRDIETRDKYKQSVEAKIKSLNNDDMELSVQDKWNNINKACKDASEEILGFIQPSNKCATDSPEIKILSQEQKELGKQIKATRL